MPYDYYDYYASMTARLERLMNSASHLHNNTRVASVQHVLPPSLHINTLAHHRPPPPTPRKLLRLNLMLSDGFAQCRTSPHDEMADCMLLYLLRLCSKLADLDLPFCIALIPISLCTTAATLKWRMTCNFTDPPSSSTCGSCCD